MFRRSTLMRVARTLPGVLAVVVCLFPLQAQDPNATVLEMTGAVSITGGPGGYETALFQGSVVRQQQMIVTGKDGYARFQVSSDGSTFEVFPNSRVVFRKNLGNWKELLDIFLGRVKVLIYHEPGKPNYNQVSSPTAVISVRGTVFDVVVEDDDGTTLVSVDEGLVSVQNITSHQLKDFDLHPGESVRVYRNVPLFGSQAKRDQRIQIALKGIRDAIWQTIYGTTHGTPGTLPGSAPGGAQGDKPKPKPGGGGTTAPGTGPSAPTNGPSAPSQGPTGPGGN